MQLIILIIMKVKVQHTVNWGHWIFKRHLKFIKQTLNLYTCIQLFSCCFTLKMRPDLKLMLNLGKIWAFTPFKLHNTDSISFKWCSRQTVLFLITFILNLSNVINIGIAVIKSLTNQGIVFIAPWFAGYSTVTITYALVIIKRNDIIKYVECHSQIWKEVFHNSKYNIWKIGNVN